MNIMRRFISGLFLTLSVLTLSAGAVQAQLRNDGNQNAFSKYYESTFGQVYQINNDQKLQDTLPTAIGRVINIALSFTGVILLCLMVYAGFLWLTAGGNEDQVGHAKQLIKNGAIGMAIALSAFVLTSFVVDQVNKALEPTRTGTVDAGPGPTKNN